MKPDPRIFPLKILGEGALSHSKNRKIDIDKLTVKESKLCRPPTIEPLEDSGVDIRVIKEMESGFPHGKGEPSTRHYY